MWYQEYVIPERAILKDLVSFSFQYSIERKFNEPRSHGNWSLVEQSKSCVGAILETMDKSMGKEENL